MDPVDNCEAAANEVVSFARQQGVDLEFLRKGHAFDWGDRFIFLWRKDELPYSGPVNQELGTLNYNMQGTIKVLPNKLKDSASAFRGAWTEAGSFENIEQAFEFLKAWLIDRREVDDLPVRSVKRYGI